MTGDVLSGAGSGGAVPAKAPAPPPSSVTPAPSVTPPTPAPSSTPPKATDAADAPAAPPTPASKRAQLATAVADAIDAVGGVRRSGGPGVQLATQFAGGRVVGVAIKDESIEVHIVAETLPLPQLVAAAHRAAVGAAKASGDQRPVDLTVDDLDVESLPPVVAR